MPRYKILKTGKYSEDWLNKVGDIVDLHPEIAKVGVEQGYLEEVKEEPKKVETIKKKRGRSRKK